MNTRLARADVWARLDPKELNLSPYMPQLPFLSVYEQEWEILQWLILLVRRRGRGTYSFVEHQVLALDIVMYVCRHLDRTDRTFGAERKGKARREARQVRVSQRDNRRLCFGGHLRHEESVFYHIILRVSRRFGIRMSIQRYPASWRP